MLQSKTENYIRTASKGDVIKWINDNPNLIYNSVDALFATMSTICNTSFPLKSLSEVIDALFTNRESVSEIEFNLLEEAVKSVVNTQDFVIELENDSNFFLFLLLMTSCDITNISQDNLQKVEHLTRSLYQAIMDVYIPLENPESIINVMIQYYPLPDIVTNAHNTTWCTGIYNENDLSDQVALSDVILSFKYISDIYANRESKLDFFFKYHRLVTGAYAYKKHFQAIVDRYQKYFDDNTSYMISELLDLITVNLVDQEEPITKIVNNFVIDWSGKFGNITSSSIMECFIRDVCTLSNFSVDYASTNMTKVSSFASSIISKMWGLPEYTHTNSPIQIKDCEETKPIAYLKSLVATEAVHKDSPVMDAASKKIYNAYRTYKDAEEKVDSQITKACRGIKNVLTGDVRTEIIEGKKFSAIGLLKQVLGTVGLFSIGPVKALIALVIIYALKKKTSVSERRKIIMELEGELTMINEKIEDARGDGNREAKYAMMRTKTELENALKRIKYGLEADQRSIDTAKSTINNIRGK